MRASAQRASAARLTASRRRVRRHPSLDDAAHRNARSRAFSRTASQSPRLGRGSWADAGADGCGGEMPKDRPRQVADDDVRPIRGVGASG
jgi:hypothetical protein